MTHDLLIIGAGIHGAACAQAAVASGYSVIVLEQYEQAGMVTSSKSSKLIHGGLRYLESGQFKLVKQCLDERRYLLRNAPWLVKLVPFYIPVYKHTRRRPWLIHLGLVIYSLLSRKGFSRLDRSHWSQLDGLKTEGLEAVFKYYDGQTNDTLLTRAVMKSAQQLGAELITHATFRSAQCHQQGCTVQFEHEQQLITLDARVIINTSGPWVNHVLKRIQPETPALDIELVLGTHIIVPIKLEQGIYYLETEDGRAVFIMPWGDNSLVGTTETAYGGDPKNISPPDADIDYLLRAYNQYFGRALGRGDVIKAFAGCRVLPADQQSAFHRARDTIIYHDNSSNPRVFTLYGGKLTAHRHTAEQVIKIIRPCLPSRRPVADTRKLKLPA